jgi:hypothetical protein
VRGRRLSAASCTTPSERKSRLYFVMQLCVWSRILSVLIPLLPLSPALCSSLSGKAWAAYSQHFERTGQLQRARDVFVRAGTTDGAKHDVSLPAAVVFAR